MPRLAPKPLSLGDEEQKEREKILARHSKSQQIAKRAKIVLLAAQGKNHRQIARELVPLRGIQNSKFKSLLLQRFQAF